MILIGGIPPGMIDAFFPATLLDAHWWNHSVTTRGPIINEINMDESKAHRVRDTGRIKTVARHFTPLRLRRLMVLPIQIYFDKMSAMNSELFWGVKPHYMDQFKTAAQEWDYF